MALSQTPSLPSTADSEHESRSGQAPPLLAFALAAFLAVIIFLPPEGRIGVPLHDSLAMLLGRATFMLPLALVLVGVLLVIRVLRPTTPLPCRRLAGIGLIALASLPSEYLLGGGEPTGLIGSWLATSMLDLIGGPTTVVLLVALLGLGAFLAFDLKVLRTSRTRAPAGGQWKDAAS